MNRAVRPSSSRSVKQPLGAARRIGSRFHRESEQGGRGRVAAPAGGLRRGAGQLGSQLLVRRDGGRGSMPGPPVTVAFEVKGGGKGLVGGAPLGT